MRTILLYGFLGKRFGRVHRYAVGSTAEAVRALSVTVKGFRQALADGGAYRVLVGGKEALPVDRIGDPVSEKETIRIVPVVAGAGRGFGQVVLGALLIAASFFIPTTMLAVNASLATGVSVGAMASGAAYLGTSLVLSGIATMMIKLPKLESSERPENKPSFAFNGAINTMAQGNPVPVLYGGPMIVGSQVVSAGLSVEQLL